jgi:hypothetical protein
MNSDFLQFHRDKNGKAVRVTLKGWHPLSRILKRHKGEYTLAELTVLDDDPFRMDTEASHRDAFWIYQLIEDLDMRGTTNGND